MFCRYENLTRRLVEFIQGNPESDVDQGNGGGVGIAGARGDLQLGGGIVADDQPAAAAAGHLGQRGGRSHRGKLWFAAPAAAPPETVIADGRLLPSPTENAGGNSDGSSRRTDSIIASQTESRRCEASRVSAGWHVPATPARKELAGTISTHAQQARKVALAGAADGGGPGGAIRLGDRSGVGAAFWRARGE